MTHASAGDRTALTRDDDVDDAKLNSEPQGASQPETKDWPPRGIEHK